ncbi:MAG: UPF0489 family protein [Caldisericaceae bacterium]|nr:UPF0489 family protein [Caldisericaceae bacterium]
MEEKLFKEAQQLYSGFYIRRPLGNNLFSYYRRKHREIYVPPLIKGSLEDVKLGSQIAFAEVEDDQEIIQYGLQYFVYFTHRQKPVFIFDNHNHAFFFWMMCYKSGIIPSGSMLLHLDQHTDMWEPAGEPPFVLNEKLTLREVFDYTNFVLNVGTFIKPALKLGLFKEVNIINTALDYELFFNEPLVLDIDLDIFAPDSMVARAKTILDKIQEWMEHAQMITIATSPFFVNQDIALKLLKEIFIM